MTFCKCSKCAKWDTCRRALTKEVTDAADRWWEAFNSSDSTPICIYMGTPDCYQEKEKQEENKELSNKNGV
jgi:hypothetical protein